MGLWAAHFQLLVFFKWAAEATEKAISCPFRETSLWSNEFASHCSPCSHSCWSFGQWAIARLVLCHLWPVNFSPPQAATLYRKELAISHFLQISTWYTDSRIQKKKNDMSPFLSMKSWVKKKKKNPRTILNLSCSYFSLLIGSELLVISDLNPLAATKVIYLFT